MDESDVHIAYKEYSPQEISDSKNFPFILLHCGTLSKETWDDCAQEIANRTESKVYCTDSRNHGDSGRADAIGYDILAGDVVRFMDSQAIPKATIVGHCLGGKVGMAFGLKYPERLESLILEDVSATTPPEASALVSFYNNTLKNSLMEIPVGTELTEAQRIVASFLQAKVVEQMIKLSSSDPTKDENFVKYCRMIAKMWKGEDLPLKQTVGGKYEWKTNLDIIIDTMESGKWPVISPVGVYEGPVLLVYGTRSYFNVLDDKERFLKQFPKTIYQPMETGTHMLHRIYPEIFTNIVCDFILQLRTSSANDRCKASKIQKE